MGLLVYCRDTGKMRKALPCPETNVFVFSNIIAKRKGLWRAIDHTLQVPSFSRGKSPVFLTTCARSSVTEVHVDLRGLACSMGGNRKPGHNWNKLIIKSALAFMSSQIT